MADELWSKLAEGGSIVERRGDEDAKAGDLYRIIGEIPALTEEINQIAKVGYTFGFSWEALAERKGHSEPVGVRWIQRVRYALLIPVFHFSKWLSGRVERSRHVSAAFGYEYEESELRPFSQKTRWVNDADKD